MNKFQKRVNQALMNAPIDWKSRYKTKKQFIQFHRELVEDYGVSYFSVGLKDKRNRNVDKPITKNSCELTF